MRRRRPSWRHFENDSFTSRRASEQEHAASQYTHFISVPLAYDDKFRQLVDGFREDTLSARDSTPALGHSARRLESDTNNRHL